MENQKSCGVLCSKETEGSKLNTGHFHPVNGNQELASLNLMSPSEVVNFQGKLFDVEEEYFVLSPEYVAMEDEYVLWMEEVNLRRTKKSVKETGIAAYEDEEFFISIEENSYCLEESYSI